MIPYVYCDVEMSDFRYGKKLFGDGEGGDGQGKNIKHGHWQACRIRMLRGFYASRSGDQQQDFEDVWA